MFEINAQVVVGGLTLVGVIITALFSYLGAVHSSQANDAVNNRHEYDNGNGSNPPKLYDIALENRERIYENAKTLTRVEAEVEGLSEWRHGYDDSPLNSGAGVKAHLARIDKLECHVEECKRRLNEQ